VSTSIPVPKARPPRDIILRVIPFRYTKRRVIIIDAGKISVIINEVLIDLKNIKIMKAAIIAPIIADDVTLFIAFLI
jgi:hypothetical protein